MAPTFCKDCDGILTPDEVHFYEDRCERCERMEHYRVQQWRAGRPDPDLDVRYSGGREPQP